MPYYDKYYGSELDALRARVMELGDLVIKQISSSLTALFDRDLHLARATIADDYLVNRLEVGIEEDCIEMLALRQPAGEGLRMVTATIKIVDNLERMGDLAVNICERIVEMEEMQLADRYVHIRLVGAICQSMVRDAMAAFAAGDIAAARQVCAQDEEVRKLTGINLQLILAAMTENPFTISRFTRKMFIAKYLEQVADRARTVAELVLFMVSGRKMGA